MTTLGFRLALASIAAACAWCLTQVLWLRAEQPWVLPLDPADRAQELAQEGRSAEARLLAEFVMRHPHLGDQQLAARVAREADRELDSFWNEARSFARGAASGEPTDMASMLGSLSLDLFVIGDIRDLVVQGWREWQYGNGDSVVMALSAVGLVTTLAPQIDWAPALLKTLKRTGSLNPRLVASLRRSSESALTSGNFKRLGATVTDLGKTAQRLGPGPTSGILKHVDETESLRHLATAAAADPQGTYALVNLFGARGVKGIARVQGRVDKLLASIKTVPRFVKAAWKMTHTLPSRWLIAALAACLVVILMSLRPRPRRRTRVRRVEPELLPLSVTPRLERR